MIIYLLISLFYFFLIFVVGFSLLSVFKIDVPDKARLSFPLIFLSGFTFLSISCAYLSLFIPLNAYVTISLAFLSAICAISYRKKLVAYIQMHKLVLKSSRFFTTGILLVLFVFAATGMKNVDSAGYHVQSIQWIKAFSAVPGLGNFHGRFAFNSLFFPISAALSVNLQIAGRQIVAYPLNAITMMFFLMWQYTNFKYYLRKKNYQGIAFLIPIALLPVIYLLKWTASPTPDLICTLLIITAIQLTIFDFSGIPSRRMLVTGIVLLCVTFKLSSALLILLIPFYFIRKAFFVEDVIRISSIGILFLFPYFILNYIYSGYLVYPFPYVDIFDPDWKIPIESVRQEKDVIEAWAKKPFEEDFLEVLGHSYSQWLPAWYAGKDVLMKLMLVITGVFPIIGLIFSKGKLNNISLITIVIMLNTLFWFVTAPDPRFFYGFIFFLFSYFLFLFFGAFSHLLNQRLLVSILVFEFLFFLAPNFVIYPDTLKVYKDDILLIVFPDVYHRSFPRPVLEIYNQGFDYFKPVDGACLNSDIPCAPHSIDPNLVMRGTTFAEGFKILKE